MITVVAESVLCGAEAFSTLGDVRVRSDRAIGPADVRDADALVVRSKTDVKDALLEGSRLAFVGTATAGYDHFDLEAIGRRGISWCAAPGCNATSVAEYVVSALLSLSVKANLPLAGRAIAVIGVGEVGRRVVRCAEALGMRPLLNDPPRAVAEGDPAFQSLDDILPLADVVTLHVPLSEGGRWPTRGMVDCRFLSRMKPGAIFINASRGEVVDESSLGTALSHGQVSRAILDVWNHEPDADPALVNAVFLATPHIAGYSWDGKLAGTRMVYEQACRFFEQESRWTAPTGNDDPATRPPAVNLGSELAAHTIEENLWSVVRQVYDITHDDRAFRAGPADRPARAQHFESLRRKYPVRREFASVPLKPGDISFRLRAALKGLGFVMG